ncbi:acyl-CoA thioesterase [Ilumatobacter sp.]|uniref:acyl-CoA thioesterase n=1 Tax=Ilumatobacter sp. TaxID=1967498 RepID=UPI003B517892
MSRGDDERGRSRRDGAGDDRARPPRIDEIDFTSLFELVTHGPDTFVGDVARYPWGRRLFGGQVVAQALRAAIRTVVADRRPHSFHSYFIRPGSPFEPVRFEVERLRDGRSFTTRQVVARQSGGAILNASVSFQVDEDEADAPVAGLPDDLPPPDDPALRDDSWGSLLDRRAVDLPDGRYGYWIRLSADLGDDPVDHVCALAFMSDAAPSRAGRSSHPDFTNVRIDDRDRFVGASLDHSVWFHRPSRADRWHWFDTRSHGLSGGRGLVTGDVLTEDGVHAATIAQQILLRAKRGA